MTVVTYPCPHCGHCEDPNRCVWGITCPRCGAGPREQCRHQNGGLKGLHPERWKEARTA